MPKKFAGPLNSVAARWSAKRWILGLIYATRQDTLVGYTGVTEHRIYAMYTGVTTLLCSGIVILDIPRVTHVVKIPVIIKGIIRLI